MGVRDAAARSTIGAHDAAARLASAMCGGAHAMEAAS
jgi:hypothetical protein